METHLDMRVPHENQRIPWFYMQTAINASKLSYCNRLKVGAVIVKANNILSFSYNGTPQGHPNQCEECGKTKPEVLHAESNAILKCSREGLSTMGSTLYCTHSPCIECSKLIVQAGIKEVYYINHYRSKEGLDFLHKSNIFTNQLIFIDR